MTRTAAFLAAFLWAGFLVASAEGQMRIDFESAAEGKVPAGFTTALSGQGEPADWVVREESGAPSGRKVLIQASSDPTKHRFPLCIHDDFTAADLTLSVVFKVISGSVDQSAGVVWRYQGPNDYYVVRANALEGNVVLYKMERGKRSDLKPVGAGLLGYGREARVAAGRWHELRVAVQGSRFAVSFDDDHLFDVEDDTFAAAGKVGLWTKADSVTAFDDLTVESSKPR